MNKIVREICENIVVEREKCDGYCETCFVDSVSSDPCSKIVAACKEALAELTYKTAFEELRADLHTMISNGTGFQNGVVALTWQDVEHLLDLHAKTPALTVGDNIPPAP